MKRPGLAVAALGFMLMLAGPSRAVEITQPPLPISSQDFGVDASGNCHGTPTQFQLDWHFVLGQSATNDQLLTVTFQNAGTITVSPNEVTANFDLDYDIYTNGDDTLLAASTSGDTGTLVLKDICSNPPPPGVELKQTLPISSRDFGVDTSGKCHGTPTQFQLDWHFVLKKSPTDDQLLTVTFQNAGTITVSPNEVTANFHLDYDIYTNGDDTLLAASTSGDAGTLDLKDICSNPPPPGVEINQTLPISSQDFGVDTRGNCHGNPTQAQLDWHFELKQSLTDDQLLTVTFQNAGTITVSPDEVTAHFVLDYDVYTNGDDTLLAASTSGDAGTLVLKDICSNPPQTN